MSTSLGFSFPTKHPQNAAFSSFRWTGLNRHLPLHPFFPPHSLTLTLTLTPTPSPIRATSSHNRRRHHSSPLSPLSTNPSTTAVSAGRSKKKPGGPSPGRIEGSGEIRRQAKEDARRRGRRLAENRFYRRNRNASKHADQFTEEELQLLGLGFDEAGNIRLSYDRTLRFLPKDHPYIRHPHDWYKYGQYGPYSWRGVVVGPPVRGRFTDERVSLISEVRDHEEWEKIDQFEMAEEFGGRIDQLDHSIGLRHYWVFARHPKWRVSELPWQQWTLVAEVVVEAGKQERIDKWSLMGRLGNKTRAMITQCAAWMRPDIIYVKRPVYQCRFEPQGDFFQMLGPLVDPETENEYPCELKVEEEGRVVNCTYFGGLCKIVKISPKAYVDDVVKAYEKLSDEGKSRCLKFLLTNHPVELLHPYTKEWKAKLEEMELGCDAPDESDNEEGGDRDANQITDWNEEDYSESDTEDEEEQEDEEDAVIDVGEDEKSEESEAEEDNAKPEETQEYWNEQWKKALSNSEVMENLVKRSLEVSDKIYKSRMQGMEEQQRMPRAEETYSASDMNVAQEEMREEQERVKSIDYRGSKRVVKKGRIPPEFFLRAAVRPFTYRHLVKEIVLMRHAIIDGDISFRS